ncbi:MAG: hypothetical protein KJT03_13550 [Verrucomicrobiae bacterium]|nr:hypothetical protein [Verrucomicrobiae bacterium]
MTSFQYIAVEWRHEHADEPVRLYSEIDSAGWEKRKVEEFRDGRMSFAGEGTSSGDTRLGEQIIPSIAEIAADAQFSPRQISKEEFECVWLAANSS